MPRPLRRRSLVFTLALLIRVTSPAYADELWVAPTAQTDFGGLGIASNAVWPVTVAGAVRLAWGVPNDLATFQSAKIVLIPHAPGGAATLNLFVCAALHGNLVGTCAGPFPHAFTGVANQLTEVDISAAIASRVGAAGLNHLAVLAYTSPTTATDHIVGLRFAYDPVLPAGVATLAANAFTDTQTAPAFAGDGSGITNVNATLLDGFDATAFATTGHGHDVSQVANAASLTANTFTATQTIDAGNLDLDASTATTGNITKSGALFLHDFGTRNTFVGLDSGNSTTTGADNTAAGAFALRNNNSGFSNTANGANALVDNINGFQNTAAGVVALTNNTSGSNNTAHGFSALYNNWNGTFNTSAGAFALHHLSSGSYNVALGATAGYGTVTGSNNIFLGAQTFGAVNESNSIRIGVQGTQTSTIIAGVRGTAVTGGIPVVVDANGRLGSGPVSPGANTVGPNEVINDSLTANDLGVASVGTAEVIDDSLTASDLAPNSVGISEVAFNYAASTVEGGPAADLACAACVGASEVNFSFATLGQNTFTASQIINAGNLDLDPSTATTGHITRNGTRFLHDFGLNNTFLGGSAGNFTLTGNSNTASGFIALNRNTEGSHNTASGVGALSLNSTGNYNTASGSSALYSNTSGEFNTASGAKALESNTTGNSNVAIGDSAGANVTTGSNNIYLGANVAAGTASEANTMRLGRVGGQTRAFIAGVRGVTVPGPAIPVLVDPLGQLGPAFSSRRYKEDIQAMADTSRRLLELRPVTFRYKQAYRDGSKPVQFGLIAEEVAETFPELVVFDADGTPETVHYETLNILLLNELQRHKREFHEQQRRIETLEQRLLGLERKTN